MSDIEREVPTPSVTEPHNPLFADAYMGCAATVARLEAKSRQSTVAAYGAVVGGIKDIPNEFVNHPWETVGKVVVAGAAGTVFGAAMAAESPLIANGAILIGATAYGASLWNSYTKLANNEKLKHAMDAVYKSGDLRTMTSSLQVSSDVIGPEAFNYGIAMAGIRGGVEGPRPWSKLWYNYLANRLFPYTPMAEVTPYLNSSLHVLDLDTQNLSLPESVTASATNSNFSPG